MKKFCLALLTLAMLLFVACGNDETSPTFRRDDDGDEVSERNRENDDETAENGGGFFTSIGSVLAVSRAIENLGAEVSERIATTPLQAIGMLAESLTYGTTTVGFTYTGEWEDWTGVLHNETASGSFRLHSDVDNMDFALSGEISVEGEALDATVYLNTNRIAVGSSLISQNLGINFGTLRQDIMDLGDMLGLPAQDIRELEDVFEIFDEAVNMLNTPFATVPFNAGAYMGLFFELFRAVEQISENVEIQAGGQPADVRRVAYTITAEALLSFLRDALDILEGDEAVASIFDMPGFEDGFGMSHRELMREMRTGLREMENELAGVTAQITIAFYIGGGDRLKRAELTGNIDFEGETAGIQATLDFGGHATDTWRLDILLHEGRNHFTLPFVWEIRTPSGRYINEISGTSPDGDNVTLSSDWNTSSGALVMGISLRDRWGTHHDEVSGNFFVHEQGFRLGFTHEEAGAGWRDEISFYIGTERGANIGNIDFVNISQWDIYLFEEIFYEIEHLFTDGRGNFVGLDNFFGGFFAGDDFYGANNIWPESAWWFWLDGINYPLNAGDILWMMDNDQMIPGEYIFCDWNGWISQGDWLYFLSAGEFGWDW